MVLIYLVKRYAYSISSDLRARVPPAAEYEYENAINLEISRSRVMAFGEKSQKFFVLD